MPVPMDVPQRTRPPMHACPVCRAAVTSLVVHVGWHRKLEDLITGRGGWPVVPGHANLTGYSEASMTWAAGGKALLTAGATVRATLIQESSALIPVSSSLGTSLTQAPVAAMAARARLTSRGSVRGRARMHGAGKLAARGTIKIRSAHWWQQIVKRGG